MSAATLLSHQTLETIQQRLDLHEIQGAADGPYWVLSSPTNGAPVGQVRLFTGLPIQKVVHVELSVPPSNSTRVPYWPSLRPIAQCRTLWVNLMNSAGERSLQESATSIEESRQPMLNIHWICLQDVLRSVLPPDIIHLQHRCIGFWQNRDAVTVHFETGNHVQAELLIGAGGGEFCRQTLIEDGPPLCGSSFLVCIHSV